MQIDMKSTIKKLKALEKRFNTKPGIENSYQCLCVVESIANELLLFADNHKPLYEKLMIEKIEKELDNG